MKKRLLTLKVKPESVCSCRYKRSVQATAGGGSGSQPHRVSRATTRKDTRLTINRVVPKEGIRRPRPIAESAVGFLGSIRKVDISGDAPRYSYTAAVVRVAD